MKLFKIYLSLVPGSIRRGVGLVTISTVAALSQGASIALLLPALSIVEEGGVPPSAGIHWTILDSVTSFLGLPLNLYSLFGGVFLFIVIAQILLYLQRRMAAAFKEDITAMLRRNIFDTLLRADGSFFHSTRLGRITNGLTEEAKRAGDAIFMFLEVINRSIIVLIYLVLLLAISVPTALAAFGVVLVAMLTIQYQVRRAGGYSARVVELNNQLHSLVTEKVSAMREVRLSSAEARESSKLGCLASQIASVMFRYELSGAQVRLIMEPIVTAGGLLIALLGLQIFNMSLAQVAVFMYILVRIAPEAQAVSRNRHAMAGHTASLFNVLNLIRDAEANTRIVGGTRRFTGLKDRVVFDNVSFSYNGTDTVLKESNMTFKAGQMTAVVGPSGVGKSTTLDLITRLVDPTSGQLMVDGRDIREFELSSLRRGVGVVSQDVILFGDTVIDNIRYPDPSASEDMVIEASRKANAHAFIRKLPQGYHTLLGDRGMTLSGGERQRIALARALLTNPSVLLLDEAVSSLDAESEQLIQDSVFRAAGERTVIVVTHRMSTVEKADHVIVLQDGRISEQGPPQQLLRSGGLFQQYAEMQSRSNTYNSRPMELANKSPEELAQEPGHPK